MPNPASDSYSWDANAGRYRNGAGLFVARADIRQAVDAVVAGAKVEIGELCNQLATGAIPLAVWQTAMAQTIRTLHTASAAAGKGGWAAMRPADWGRVGYLTRLQYHYLAEFAGQIESGAVNLQTGQLVTRAGMYADAATQTYEQTARVAALEAPGLATEYNILGEADHCVDCLAATAAGRVPIGTLQPPGARACQTRCHCTLGYA